MTPHNVFLTEGEQVCNTVEASLWIIRTELENTTSALDSIQWTNGKSKGIVNNLKYRVNSLKLSVSGIETKVMELRHNQEAHK